MEKIYEEVMKVLQEKGILEEVGEEDMREQIFEEMNYYYTSNRNYQLKINTPIIRDKRTGDIGFEVEY